MLGPALRRWVHRYQNIPQSGVYNKGKQFPERTVTRSPMHRDEESLYEPFPRVGMAPSGRRPQFTMLRLNRQSDLLRQRIQQLLTREKIHGRIKSALDAEEQQGKPRRKTRKQLADKPPPGMIELEADEVTGLPLGLGFEKDIQEVAEKRGKERGEKEFLKVAQEMGIKTIEEARARVVLPDLESEKDKIRKKLYTQRDKNADLYHGIEFRQDPRSIEKDQTSTEEFYEVDMSDDESGYGQTIIDTDRFLKSRFKAEEMLGVAPRLYKSIVEGKDADDLSESEASEDEDPDPSPITHYPNLFWPEDMSGFMKRVAEYRVIKPAHERLNAIRNQLHELYRSPEKRFDTRGRMDTRLWKEKMKLFTHQAPTLKDVMREVDETIEISPLAQRLMQRDEYEGNSHFKPRYLDKDFREDDFGWAHEHLKNIETLSSGIVYGDINLRMSGQDVAELENAKRKAHHEPMTLTRESQDAITIFGLIKRDPYYSHFLDNHVRFWGARYSKDPMSLTARPDAEHHKAFDLIPWETILINRTPELGVIEKHVRKPDRFLMAHGFGSRKCARAYAYVKPGIGKVTINGRALHQYFPQGPYRMRIVRPFGITDLMCEFDVKVTVSGGGSSAQSQASMLAVSRALALYGPEFNKFLRKKKELKANPRQVERKKTSLYKARKGYTFVKR